MTNHAVEGGIAGAAGNYVATRFAELCTGAYSLDQIIEIVGSERSLEKVLLRTDLTAHFRAWRDAGLVEERDGRPALTEKGSAQLRHLRVARAPGITRLLWDVTRRCNLKCHHCYAYRDGDVLDELSLEDMTRVMDRLAAMPPYLVVFGGGEPFVRTDFLDILAATKAALGCRIKVLTNGTLLDRPRLRAVKPYVDFLQFSLDGRKRNHHLLRGKDGCFGQTCDAIALAAEEGFHVGICMTLNRRNVEDIEWMIDFALAHGAYKLRISPLVLAGKASLSIEEWALPAAEMKTLYPQLFEYRVRYKDRLLLDFRDELYGNAFLTGCTADAPPGGSAYFLCAAGRSLFYVNPEGFVTPCNFIDTPRYFLGNVKTDDVVSIWRYHPVLHQLRGLDVNSIATCSSCNRKRRCGGGLRCNAVMLHDDFAAPDPFCHFYEKSRDAHRSPAAPQEATP